ncbi:MAG: FoF1 ATP synthase subunit gamma [Candidatus Sulfotelmatobacter sp.]
MANILDIRRRIRSVVNTRQITKAMKVVSAAKLRRAQERALAARPYARMLTNVLKSLTARADVYDPETGELKHFLLARRPEKNIVLVVVTGDKGLAGAFSANVIKAATRFIESKAGKNIDLETIGRKGRDFLRRRYPVAPVHTRSLPESEESVETFPPETAERSAAIQITGEHIGILGKLEFSQARALAENLIGRYRHEEIDAVYVVFNEFKSVIAQRLIVEQILPIEQVGEQAIRLAEEMTEAEKKKARDAAVSAGVGMHASEHSAQDTSQFGTAPVDYIYEQAPQELFRALLPKYVAIQIFRALLESVAAEHAARMTAMDSATGNATDIIDSLTLAMNRARQAKITKEIIEIVSGAAAM